MFRILLLFLLEVVVEVTELIGDDVRIRQEVKLLFSILLLHFVYIDSKFVLSCNLEALREMVYLLVLVEPLV